MNAHSVSKFLTLVGFLMIAVVNSSYAEPIICENMPGVTRNSSCEKLFGSDALKAQIPACEKIVQCLKEKKEEEDKDKQDKKEAADKTRQEKKDNESECKQSLKDYDDAIVKTTEECGRLEADDIPKCQAKAKSCAKGIDSSQPATPEGEDPAEKSDSVASGIMGVLNVYGQMNAGDKQTGPVAGCLIENDDKEADRQKATDDKVAKLKKDITRLKEDAIKEDGELAKKKLDAKKEMQDIEDEATKAKFEKQSKDLQDVARMEKNIVDSTARKKKNLDQVTEIEVELSNLTYAEQELNLSMSENKITQDCRNAAKAEFAAKTGSTIDPKTGKEVKTKFSLKESLAINKNIKAKEITCLKTEALKKQAKAKSLYDAKNKMQRNQVKLTDANIDETAAIEKEIKQMEEMKKLATAQDAKKTADKIARLMLLNESVTDMAKMVKDKKVTYGEEAANIQKQIDELLLERLNVKPKFVKVSNTIAKSKRSASTFIGKCCPSKTATSPDNNAECSRVMGDFPEVTVKSKSKTAAPVKGQP